MMTQSYGIFEKHSFNCMFFCLAGLKERKNETEWEEIEVGKPKCRNKWNYETSIVKVTLLYVMMAPSKYLE